MCKMYFEECFNCSLMRRNQFKWCFFLRVLCYMGFGAGLGTFPWGRL